MCAISPRSATVPAISSISMPWLRMPLPNNGQA
jgi:hypothetical protein